MKDPLIICLRADIVYVILKIQEELEDENDYAGADQEHITQAVSQASILWPFTSASLSTPSCAKQLVAHLPTFERASALIETYYIQFAWLRCPVDRTQVTLELIPLFYPRWSSTQADNAALALKYPHELAILFALFSLGALIDLTLTMDNAESARYYMLARAALGLRNIFDHTTVSTCQAVYLLSTYSLHAAHGLKQESSWRMASLGASLASSVSDNTRCVSLLTYSCLLKDRFTSVTRILYQCSLLIRLQDRDPGHWKLDPDMVEKRRKVFWEIYLVDLWRVGCF